MVDFTSAKMSRTSKVSGVIAASNELCPKFQAMETGLMCIQNNLIRLLKLPKFACVIAIYSCSIGPRLNRSLNANLLMALIIYSQNIRTFHDEYLWNRYYINL